jgi:hypothetical protein
MCAKPWHILSWDVFKNSVHADVKPETKLITVAAKQFHITRTNDWCYGVPRDFDGPSVPSHGTF